MTHEPPQPDKDAGLEDIRPQGLAELANAGPERPETAPAVEAAAAGESHEPLAVVSDIHGNIEAFSAVLADIERRGVQRIICLGDVVGYGPNPRECLDLVMERCAFSLMGNHDFAVLYEPYNFNSAAEMAAFWTRQQFEADPDRQRRNQRWVYLGAMPVRGNNGRFCCFHGSPRRPINEYVFTDDIYAAPQKMAAIFDRIPRLCFVGHTHVPGVFVPDPDFYSPDELGGRYKLTDERALVNVGSVGQPRDRNPDASYVILYEDSVEFLRVPYDVETTKNKVLAIDALDNFLGARLVDGR